MWLGVITIALSCALLVESVPSGVESFEKPSEALVNFADEDEGVNYRLPNNSIPLRYEIWLKTDVEKQNFEFSGRVKIHIKIVEDTNVITLHHRQITIEQIDLLNTSRTLTSSRLFFRPEPKIEFLTIMLPRDFKEDEEFILDITYKGTLRNDKAGFYRASYKNEKNETVWFATTQLQMTDARHAFPCYDEPAIRAVISLEIQHDQSYTAVSNMPIISRSPLVSTNYVTSRFQDTPAMQSYLLAFIVSNYDFISNSDSVVPQRVFAKPQSIKAGEANFTLSVVGPILKQIETTLNVSYPLTKMDHAFIADFVWGAVENFGLITYKESRMIPSDGDDKSIQEKHVIELVAHEYAHQWFGNLVAPKWWSYAWLNEGFATLFEYYIPSLIYPDVKFMKRFKTSVRDAAFVADVEAKKTVALNHYVQTPQGIHDKFNSISYNKAASVLYMFQQALTVGTFTKGVSYYVKDMYYKVATPKDLHKNLQKAYDEDFPEVPLDIDDLMSSWENQAGFPVISVRRSNKKLFLRQGRYGGGDNGIYAIPLTYATKANPDFDKITPKVWFTSRSMELDVDSPDWLILNMQQTGYYKVSYDKASWDAILNGLKNDRNLITAIHRCQLFKDMNDKTDDVISVRQAFGLLETLSKDGDAEVWNCAGSSVADVFWKRLYGTSLMTKYHEFIHTLVQAHVKRLKNETSVGEDLGHTNFRTLITKFDCLTNCGGCLKNQQEMLLAKIELSEIPDDFCLGMLSANETTYKILLENMLVAKNKTRKIASLGCAKDPNVLSDYLKVTLDLTNGLTVDDRTNILISTAKVNVEGLEAVLKFINGNHESIKKV